MGIIRVNPISKLYDKLPPRQPAKGNSKLITQDTLESTDKSMNILDIFV